MKKISIYDVEDTPIGTGGMGRVFRGTDPQGRQVAIKEILPEFAADLEIRTRTEREVEILQILNDTEGIVKVYDRFPMNNNFYIVMEYVDGMNIEQYVQRYGSIPYERAVRYMINILEIMQSVHEKQIVHRDMKPSNIMIRNDERICILDFGIAKDLGNMGNGTAIGTQIGSDGYMSPEQADCLSIDHRSDIYALGCVFYYMLTGHHAYNTLASDFETRSNIVNTPFPKLSKHSKKSFPSRLQEILDHATDKNMMKRYQSSREFRIDLENLHGGQTVINPSTASNNVFITVGREECDIIVNDPNMRVSRHHLDIALKEFTGGRYFVVTDHSSNGTIVNGQKISRNESEQIPADGQTPIICLACDENIRLDWEEVKKHIASKMVAASETSNDDPIGGTMINVPNEPFGPIAMNTSSTPEDISFTDAIKLFFTRAFDFKGRSRRKEYWYVVLAITILYIPYYFATIDAVINNNSSYTGIIIVYLIFSLFCLVPNISLTIRRLHDIGKDWTAYLWWLVGLIPIAGAIAALVLSVVWIYWMATDSDPLENKWGPCPK